MCKHIFEKEWDLRAVDPGVLVMRKSKAGLAGGATKCSLSYTQSHAHLVQAG
jgi:hypothetical protein